MSKIIYRILAIAITTLFFSSISSFNPDNTLMGTLFTVSGIMFSIGLGLIVNFDLREIKNKKYRNSIRDNLNKVRDSFIFHFSLSTVCFLGYQYFNFRHSFFEFISIDSSIFFLIAILYSIIYFIMNFKDIQKLNAEIVDRLNQSE